MVEDAGDKGVGAPKVVDQPAVYPPLLQEPLHLGEFLLGHRAPRGTKILAISGKGILTCFAGFMAIKASLKSKTALPYPRSRVLKEYKFKDPAMKAWVAKLLDSFTDQEAEALAKGTRRKSSR
ncbi:hypothetical protein MGR01S_13250 [Meiothermus granaticius NBRC 107808]|nr:hypothetical protein MGR01S_13250 [Meiothermus granaticius NBRC 107808]